MCTIPADINGHYERKVRPAYSDYTWRAKLLLLMMMCIGFSEGWIASNGFCFQFLCSTWGTSGSWVVLNRIAFFCCLWNIIPVFFSIDLCTFLSAGIFFFSSAINHHIFICITGAIYNLCKLWRNKSRVKLAINDRSEILEEEGTRRKSLSKLTVVLLEHVWNWQRYWFAGQACRGVLLGKSLGLFI